MKRYLIPEIDILYFSEEEILTTSATYSEDQLTKHILGQAVEEKPERTISVKVVPINELSGIK